MKLSSRARQRMKPSQFAVPELDGYPIHDPQHLALAKGRLTQFGSRLTKGEEKRAWERIAQAERKFAGKGRHASSSATALARLPAKTIVELTRKKLIRFL